MSDLRENEIITDKSGQFHYRFLSYEPSQDSANKLCESLTDQGFCAAQFPVEDGRFAIFTKLSPDEQILYIIDQAFCEKCPLEFKAEHCTTKDCKHKAFAEDAKWDAQHRFFTILQYKLAKLRRAIAEGEKL